MADAEDDKKKLEEKKAIRRIMKVNPCPLLSRYQLPTDPDLQELKDIEQSPMPGTRITWDDNDLFTWHVEMDGPPSSPYAVRPLPFSSPIASVIDALTGRHIPHPLDPLAHLPLPTPRTLLPDQDLPPKSLK